MISKSTYDCRGGNLFILEGMTLVSMPDEIPLALSRQVDSVMWFSLDQSMGIKLEFSVVQYSIEDLFLYQLYGDHKFIATSSGIAPCSFRSPDQCSKGKMLHPRNTSRLDSSPEL